MRDSALLATNDQSRTELMPTNRRSKSSPVGFEVELRHPTFTQKASSDYTGSRTTNGPPKTFQDILPPQFITTSTLSEAGYKGYRKSKFKSTSRASTLPAQPSSQTVKFDPSRLTEQRVYPPTSRQSTLKKMRGVMHSIKRSISTLNDSKMKTRPPIPSSSTFAGSNSQSRFGTGPGRHSFGRQDEGYLNLSDGEDVIGDYK